jgi:hypothetical protein
MVKSSRTARMATADLEDHRLVEAREIVEQAGTAQVVHQLERIDVEGRASASRSQHENAGNEDDRQACERNERCDLSGEALRVAGTEERPAEQRYAEGRSGEHRSQSAADGVGATFLVVERSEGEVIEVGKRLRHGSPDARTGGCGGATPFRICGAAGMGG